jgi:hypothetical protein
MRTVLFLGAGFSRAAGLEPPAGLRRIARMLDADLRVDPEEWEQARRSWIGGIESIEPGSFLVDVINRASPPDGLGAVHSDRD